MYSKYLKYLIVWNGHKIENALLERALDVFKTHSFLYKPLALRVLKSVVLMEWGKDQTNDWQLIWERW